MSARTIGAALALAALACGGGGDSGAADGGAPQGSVAGDAQAGTIGCDLLTAADASRIMAEPMQAGVERLRVGDPSSGTGMLQCQHDAAGSSSSLSVQVQWHRDFDRPASFAEFTATLREQAADSDNRIDQINLEMIDEAVAVESLGRFGYWLPDARTLTVHTGRGHAVTIGVARWGSGSSPEADLTIARDAAAMVLDKL